MVVFDLVNKLRHSKYWKNIGLLSGTQGLSMAVPIAAAPILGRLYSPSEYAFLALYMSFSGLLGASTTLQMHQSIIAEKRHENIPALISMVLITGLGVSALSFLLAIVLWKQVFAGTDFAEFGPWFLLLAFSTAGTTISSITINFAHRLDKYSFLAVFQFVTVLLTTLLSIVFGLLGFSTHGLMLSYMITQVVLVATMMVYGFKIGAFAGLSFGAQSFNVYKRHKDFAFFTFPSEFINTFAGNVPLYALSYIGAITPLGAFNRAAFFSSVPLKLVGLAVAPVFRRRVRDDLAREGSCRRIYIQTLIFLAAIALPFSAIVYVFGPAIFAFILGEDWRIAGEIASIIAPMACAQTLAAPLSAVYQINEGQRSYFKFIAIGLCVSLSTTFFNVTSGFSYEVIILVYSACYTILHALVVIDGYRNQTIEKTP
ncbi:MAG: oligosaccharide flippase family protein [Pseudomonadota bacterium]